MRTLLLVAGSILLLGLLVLFMGGHSSTDMRLTSRAEVHEDVDVVGPVGIPRATSSIASYPDRGQLLASDHQREVIRSGASTWHPVQISEEHALRSIGKGGMTVPGPNSKNILLRYERHVEHPDGNWTWIGREDGSVSGAETVLTFGEKAVFGVIRQASADLRLTTEAGSTWLVETDYSRIKRNPVAANDDFLMPPSLRNAPRTKASSSIEKAVGTSAEVTPTPTTVDIAVGFTEGFATRLGGESQARTRVNFLVDITNQAYTASGINAQIRLVHALQVNYPDATNNRTALYDLTGLDCNTQANGAHYLADRRVECTQTTQSVGLQPLAAARNTYGADLLVLVRKFEAPQQGSCGYAWMLGGGQNVIDTNSAPFGTAMVSDSSGGMFPDEGATCPETMLAHELGHNMGQQHDVVTARGTDDSDSNGDLLDPEEFGHHAYSFGYSTDDTGSDVATIMSNRRSSQTRYRVFSNPLISSCGNAPCGIADQADNARSMNITMSLIAQFRTAVGTSENMVCDWLKTDFNGDGRSDLFWRHSTEGWNSIWLSANSSTLQSVAPEPSQAWQVAGYGDFNGDGRSDILWRHGGAGWNVVWNSANPTTATTLAYAPAQDWNVVGVGDFDGDGLSDIFWRNPVAGWNVYWPGGDWSAARQLVTVADQMWRVAGIGDFDGDGQSDVLWRHMIQGWNVIWKSADSETRIEVAPVLSQDWQVAGIGDFDADGKADVFWRHSTQGWNVYWPAASHANAHEMSAVPDLAWKIVGIADFDGDGRSDLFWRHMPEGWNSIWRSADSVTSSPAVPEAQWQVAGMCRRDLFARQ